MYRGTLNIVASILNVTEKGALKGYIIDKCRLSSKQFNEYVQMLLENGLLNTFPAVNLPHMPGRKSNRRTIFYISETGKHFLKLYSELYALVDRYVADSFLGNSPSPSAKRFCNIPPQTRKVSESEC